MNLLGGVGKTEKRECTLMYLQWKTIQLHHYNRIEAPYDLPMALTGRDAKETMSGYYGHLCLQGLLKHYSQWPHHEISLCFSTDKRIQKIVHTYICLCVYTHIHVCIYYYIYHNRYQSVIKQTKNQVICRKMQ